MKPTAAQERTDKAEPEQGLQPPNGADEQQQRRPTDRAAENHLARTECHADSGLIIPSARGTRTHRSK